MDLMTYGCSLFVEHHGVIFNILWEMVVSSDTSLKINATALLKALVSFPVHEWFNDLHCCLSYSIFFKTQVPYVDVKIASTHILPALITLGSDQNLTVKYASIDAFGAVAQHFKNDMVKNGSYFLLLKLCILCVCPLSITMLCQVVDKIRIQMDAFLEDGSHEATISVIRALAVAVPHSTDRLREYILLWIPCLHLDSSFAWSLACLCVQTSFCPFALCFLWHDVHLLTKIFKLTSITPSGDDFERRRERANVYCEAGSGCYRLVWPSDLNIAFLPLSIHTKTVFQVCPNHLWHC